MSVVAIIPFLLFLIFAIASIALGVYVMTLVIKALKKYINSKEVREEKNNIKKSLGEVLKTKRMEKKLTQEYVAECIGVSRQAVSKWESGTSDPSTSNLLALAKLYEIPIEELVKEIK